jgi:hypothetical protein
MFALDANIDASGDQRKEILIRSRGLKGHLQCTETRLLVTSNINNSVSIPDHGKNVIWFFGLR